MGKMPLTGGEQWRVRKQLCASRPQQRIWRAAARGVQQRFVILGVPQLTFFGGQL